MTPSKTAWRESLDRTEARLDPYLVTDDDGATYLPQHPALARLVKFYDELIVTGLEFGWVDLTADGALA